MYLKDSIASSKTPIRRKFDIPDGRGKCRVYADGKERPFSRLAAGDLLDTADLCQLYGVSLRTIYRWMTEHGLEPTVKHGRDHLFRKEAIVAWDERARPSMGRPVGS